MAPSCASVRECLLEDVEVFVPDRTIIPRMARRLGARAAARNNAEWCHTFSRTHGTTGCFRAAYWSSPARTPPYYPDAITLRPEVTIRELLSNVERGEGCSVKDSFACLELGTVGFQPLFRADWLVREPAGAAPRSLVDGRR